MSLKLYDYFFANIINSYLVYITATLIERDSLTVECRNPATICVVYQQFMLYFIIHVRDLYNTKCRTYHPIIVTMALQGVEQISMKLVQLPDIG
jgi:hypothetical protein